MKKYLKLLAPVLYVTSVVFLILFISFYWQDILETYYISKISPNLVKISKDEISFNGYGTGFYIKAQSGLTYILTNHHVCNLSENDTIFVLEEGKRPVKKRIIERFLKADLCLIEAPINREGLALAKSYLKDERVFVLGFPSFMPLTFSSGSLIGNDELGEFGTTISVLGGNSGSPVLNKYGNVVGVIWGARIEGAGWAVIVSLDYIKEFLSVY